MVSGIISKIEGTINTAVGKIKKNADGHAFDEEGAKQEELGKKQLNEISPNHKSEGGD